jgi:hypothetical protein
MRFRPHLEALDDRIVPSQVNLAVTSLADSGPGSLREAILAADAGASPTSSRSAFLSLAQSTCKVRCRT